MILDIEGVLDNFEKILKADINTEIEAINAEKSDTITLSTVSEGAYAYQSLDHEVLNYDPVVLFGVIDIENNNNGPVNAQNLTISIVVIAVDDTDGENMTRKMLRYQRAVKQTLEKNWQNGAIRNKIEIDSQLPARIKGLNDSQTHRVVGVEVKTYLT